MCPSLAEPDSDGIPKISHRQLKSFSVQQFFKNAAEVWASSPHLRSKSKLHHRIKRKSRRESEESQLLFRIKKVVMRDKVSGAIAISKASWGCAPALPNRTQVVSLGQAAGK